MWLRTCDCINLFVVSLLYSIYSPLCINGNNLYA